MADTNEPDGMDPEMEKLPQHRKLKRGGKAINGEKPKDRLDKKSRGGSTKWIQGAIKHPGALTKSAKKAGESTHEFAEKHKHDSGKTGNRARLALTLSKMHHKKD